MVEIADARVIGFISQLRARFMVEKAIIFGSRARGDFMNDSDYDILIVSPDFKGIPMSERIANVLDMWEYYPVDMDPLCFTPDEFKKKRHQIGIVQKAIQEGIEIA
jgi:predicted nucleotidyltransferase